MSQFTNDADFTRLVSNVAGNVTFNNVAATTNELRAISTGANTLTFGRLVDTPSDALTFGAFTDADNTTIATLVANDEEPIHIVDGGATTAGRTFRISALKAADLVTLNVSGATNFNITIDATATALTTVDASANTGSVTISAIAVTSPLTMTGSATAKSSLNGGKGADHITAGNAGNTLGGQDNDDTLIGGSGVDTIAGGAGNDSLTGGGGNDILRGGAGDDTIDLTETIAARDWVWLETTVAANGTDTVLGFTAGAGGDLFRVSPLMSMNATALNAKLIANPEASDKVDSDVNLLVDIADGEDITRADGLMAALAADGEYANVDMTDGTKAVFVTAANSEAGTQYVFYATAAAGVITASLVGIISNVDIDDFVLSNFNS
jgi:Ca2+-binding RTX toxin-like protein